MPVISKRQPNGNISWSRYLFSDNPDSAIIFADALELSNYDIVVYGVCTYNSNQNLVNNIILRLDSSGNLLDYKTFKTVNLPNGSGGVIFNRGYLCELTNGQVGLLGCLNDLDFSGQLVIMLALIDGGNNIIWSKSYYDFINVNERIAGLATFGNALYIAGVFEHSNSLAGFEDLGDCIAKLSSLNGDIIADKNIYYSQRTATALYSRESLSIAASNPGLIRVFSDGVADLMDNGTLSITYDTSLNIIKSKVIKGFNLSGTGGYITSVNRNGFFALTSLGIGNEFYYMVADSNDNILQSRKVKFPSGFTADLGNLRTGLSDNNTFVSNLPGKLNSRYVIDDIITNTYSCDNSCIGTDTVFASINNFPLRAIKWGLTAGRDGMLQEIPFNINMGSLNIQRSVTCSSFTSCDSISISGPDTICDISSPTVFKALKHGNCCGKVSWQIDSSAYSSLTSLSDTSIAVQFKKNWNGFLYVSINKCKLIIDSLKIDVLKLPGLVNLGADTSFCNGASIALDAGNGFVNYSWNTGASTQIVNPDTKGTYIVKATLSNGCYASDTLQVLNVFPKPLPSIYPRDVICKGQSDSLDAGNGYTSYLWQDGSTDQFFAANTTGKYWVTVTNNNSCIGSDTVIIRTITDTPSNFIYADTSICQYETIVLKPFNSSFIQYKWNNGTNQSYLSVNSPGNYSLKVTDVNGCTGIQNINVNPKTCINRLIFPNAFTPDRNLNTVFKPFARGEFLNYELLVYNRWGQNIFKTKDPSSGWDGTVAGKIQDTGVFVWICKYQYYGEQPNYMKGTVLLIR